MVRDLHDFACAASSRSYHEKSPSRRLCTLFFSATLKSIGCPRFCSARRGTPTTFAPNQVISGWTEAMQMMVEGDKWEMYIPSDLAYGDRGRPPKIQGGDALIFTMEILKNKGNKVKREEL